MPGNNDSSKVGIDTGGTFTDFVWLDDAGRLQVRKELSTPADPAEAILSGIRHLAVRSEAAIIHGSTVATNALLERRGARTALITTRGFRDILAIGRQNRPDLYALVPRKPEPLVPGKWRFEVTERVTAGGYVQEPIDESDVDHIIDQMLAEGIESVAVCLLFSFLHPEHERRIGRAIAARQEVQGIAGHEIHVSLSSDILPEYREYERTATTVINAYVAPLMAGYLYRLEREIAPRPLAVMQSNGGVIGAARAGQEAARTVLSGPAGGVVGARYSASLAGYDQLITFDMGGTSTDMALCPGRLPTTSEGEIAGLPLRLPIIDIHTVGAGGGSLAHVDPGGALQVGPRSAGADPGPACYGRSALNVMDGERTTVTDANLVLGRLDVDHFLGGAMRLDLEASQRVMDLLAGKMGSGSPEGAAWGVIQVANANIERAIRRISVERGHDPRDFTLLAFGGAGPLHACELAEEMQIPRVLVPPLPGVLSALGMLVARPARDYSLTVMEPLAAGADGQSDWLAGRFAALRSGAVADMVAEGHAAASLELEERLDMRYQGQSHELSIPIAPDAGDTQIAVDFHEAHQRRYGFQWPEKAIQVVNLRLVATVRQEPLDLPDPKKGQADARAALIGRKPVWFDGRTVESDLYDRGKLLAGNRLNGPAIIFQYDTTTVIPPGWEARVDDFGHLLLTRRSSAT